LGTFASLIAAFVSGEALVAVRRAKGNAIAYIFVAIFGMVGVGFLVGAGYIAAARRFGSLEAAIGFGVGFLLVALLIIIGRKIALSRRRSRTERRKADMAAIIGAATVSALPLLLRSRAGLVGPLVALGLYALYRENIRSKDEPDEER
jgi:protein-S-isoprenylcysteine O-methyltransferase Ste14